MMTQHVLHGVLAFCIALVCTVHGEQVKLAEHPDVGSNLTLLEAWIQAQMAYKGIPGMSVAIVHDQELIYARGFGHADLATQKAATPETVYRIASHSKLFTAIAIMQLRDAGKLRLEDPVGKHLPWFKIRGLAPASPPVTIQHLLTHTSGLPREAKAGYWGDFRFPAIDEIRGLLPSKQAVYPTETRWKYSNLALVLAGEIVAAVSGQPYAEYVEESIFRPLGMNSTSVALPDGHRSRLATGYGRRLPDGTQQILPFVDIKGLAAAGGVSSTVADMARFVSWQFRLRHSDRREVLKSSTLKEMQRMHWLDPGWKNGWGLGFNIVRHEDRTLVGHSGSYPGYRTATYISPTEKVGVIVFANSLDAQPYPGQTFSVVDRAFEWVASAITRAIDDPRVEAPDPSWTQLEGTYRSFWQDVHVLVLEGKLAFVDPTVPDPKETAATLEPVGKSKQTFRLAEGSGYLSLGEAVVFELDADGRACSVTINEVPLVRVKY